MTLGRQRREPRAGGVADLALAEDARARPRRCRSSRSRSSPAPSSSAPTSGRSSPTCASPARSSRTPTSSMFIYRDEYYNEESDQQGLAEVILVEAPERPDRLREALVPQALREVRRPARRRAYGASRSVCRLGEARDQEDSTMIGDQVVTIAPRATAFTVVCEPAPSSTPPQAGRPRRSQAGSTSISTTACSSAGAATPCAWSGRSPRAGATSHRRRLTPVPVAPIRSTRAGRILSADAQERAQDRTRRRRRRRYR